MKVNDRVRFLVPVDRAHAPAVIPQGTTGVVTHVEGLPELSLHITPDDSPLRDTLIQSEGEAVIVVYGDEIDTTLELI